MERCYKCGRAYRKGENSIGVMARPERLTLLKERYTFKSIHYPQCPDGAKRLKDRRYSHYNGSKVVIY